MNSRCKTFNRIKSLALCVFLIKKKALEGGMNYEIAGQDKQRRI